MDVHMQHVAGNMHWLFQEYNKAEQHSTPSGLVILERQGFVSYQCLKGVCQGLGPNHAASLI